MKVTESKILFYLTRIAIVVFFATGFFMRCANPMQPQGGPKDTLPPKVVGTRPAMGTTNFKEKRVFIEFDEYVQLKNQQAEFYTSPAMKKKPILMIRGRGIQIDIQDTLNENTTYSLNFGSSIEDNNEGNPLHSFRYVFSTGDFIDSMVMSGYAADAYKKDSASKTFIYFFKAEKDSIPDYDSVMFNCTPDAIARAENNGIFIAENLKPIPYKIYAMQDENGNQQYEPGVDKIGFLEETFNPKDMPGFEVWLDTMRGYLVAQPQIYFRMFKDAQFKRQYLAGMARPLSNKAILNFGADYPEIDTIAFEGIDHSRIIVEQLKPTKDSIAYWFNVPREELPDTIKGFVTYMMHDTLNNLVANTKELSLVWQESKQAIKEREEREKERKKTIEAGEEPEPEPNPFKVSVEVRGDLNPEKHIPMTFDYPLVEMDSSRISLIRVDGENMYRVRYTVEQDTANLRRWLIKASWMPTHKYRLEIPQGVFVNVAAETNDTLKAEFAVMDPQKYATLVFNVKPKREDSKYVLQLMDKEGNKIVTEVKNVTGGKYVFKYVEPGEVSLRVVEDMNGNGIWDPGNMVERRQPERVEMFKTETGEQTITTRANWELEFDIDMNKMFAPITMEQLMKQLQREEEIRVRKYLEELEKNPPKKEQRQQQTRTPSFGGMGGIGGRF